MTTSTLSRGQVVADPNTERTVRMVPWRLVMRHAYWWLPTLLAVMLVPYQAWRPVLDWDEPATWDASTRSVSELVALARHIDGVLLPYYLFMHYWVRVFGDSELMLRAPSILAVIATVPIVAVLARRLFDSRVALLAALLFAGLPTVSRYGQEARPYGLALLFAAAATLLLVWALETPTRSRWVAYGVAVALLGLTQLLALLLLIAHGAAVGYRWWRASRIPHEVSHRRTAVRWGTAVGLAVVPCIPLAVLGFLQRDSQLNWLPESSWATLRSFPNEVMWAPALGWFLIGISLLARHRYRDRVRYLAVMAVVPAAVLYLLGLFAALWVPRYVMFSVIAWCILAAVAVAGSWLRIGVMLVIVAILVVPAQQTIRRPGAVGDGIVDGSKATASYQVGDHRAAMQIIAENYRPGDGIVYEPESAWSLRLAVHYYLNQSKWPSDVLLTRSARSNNTFKATECSVPRRCLAGVQRIWIYRVGEHYSNLDYFPGPIPQALREDYQLGNHWSVHNGTVEIYLRKASPPGTTASGGGMTESLSGR